jgi:hypothetical protein
MKAADLGYLDHATQLRWLLDRVSLARRMTSASTLYARTAERVYTMIVTDDTNPIN